MAPEAPKRLSPCVVDETPRTVAWCACGESAKDPYCDGSHERLKTGKKPVIVRLDTPRRVAWCACKLSESAPYCNGSHARWRVEREESEKGKDVSIHEKIARKNERLARLMRENEKGWADGRQDGA